MRGATETITVFNRYLDSITKTEVWFRHIVPNCSWEVDNIRSVDSNGTARLATSYTVLVDENKDFLPEDEWNALEIHGGKFTFQVGDLVILGAGYPNLSPTEIKKKYPHTSFTIQSFTNNTQGYKRGRHYDIRGV